MLQTTCKNLLATFKQPVLVETFLPGREFTVGIVGNGAEARSIGVLEVVLLDNSEPEVYSYHNKAFFEDLVEYRVVDDAEAQKAKEVALACYVALGCNDAGRVDLRSDGNGLPHFIEINSLAGLHPEISDLSIMAIRHGISYQQLISQIVSAAMSRLGIE
jgi:D-alanine-D-alanine ligase